jgi:hypothetical protein
MFLNLKKNEIKKWQAKIREDPLWHQREILKRTLWEKEEEILLALRDNPEVAVRSCNASGKTFTAAGAVHWWLMGFPHSIVITTAPTFRQVKDILWREIRAAVVGKGFYDEDKILDTKISIRDRWFALGLSTDQPDQFQGFHSPYLLAVIDEASGVDDVIFEAIDGLKPNKILAIGNPLRNTGRFAKMFQEPGVVKISISAFDTPNVKAGKIIIPGLITLEDVEKFKQRYGEDSDVYRVRVLGEFPKAEAESLISIDDVAKAMAREVQVLPQWEKKLGVDVARYGTDRTVFIVRQMEKVLRKEVFTQQETMAIAGLVIKIAKEEGVKPENIFLDETGLGAGVVDRLREENWNVNGVNVASSAEDEEHYANLRAELGWKIKEWLKTAQLPKDDDFYEMVNIRYKFNSKGQLLLESKEDIKKRGLPSPDVFDALMLTFAKPTGRREPAMLQVYRENAEKMQKNQQGLTISEIQKAIREGKIYGWWE